MEISSAVLQRTRERTLNCLKYKLHGLAPEVYEDAVQKAFFDLFAKQLWSGFVVEEQLVQWLSTAAWWHALKELKWGARQVAIDGYVESAQDEAIAQFENAELIAKLRAKLPTKKAQVVEDLLAGFTLVEIAKRSEEKYDTVKHRVNSALRTMQTLWEIEMIKK